MKRLAALMLMASGLVGAVPAASGAPRLTPQDICENAFTGVAGVTPPGLPASKRWSFDTYLNVFRCGSYYKDIGISATGLANNISFYAKGTRDAVERVRVMINVNQPDDVKRALPVLASAGDHLSRTVFSRPLPPAIEKALLTGKPGTWTIDGLAVDLVRDTWPTGRGYELNFVVRRPTVPQRDWVQ